MVPIRTALFGLVLLLALAVSAGSATGSTPPTTAITVPAAVGQTVSVTWTGTIPPGANATSSCAGIPAALTDFHTTNVTVPAGAYNTVRARFTFTITWPSNVDDEILTVLDSSDAELGSSDGGSNVETIVLFNLSSGAYDSIACPFASGTPVNYTGKLEIVTSSPTASLPSAPAQGFEFSAAVAADNQRDEAEPLIEIDRSGKIYTCGPTGFSNASDYAQISTDGGDQFHMLGTPPRGQQGTGGGGDCGLAMGVTPNAQGNYQYTYSGLGPLTGFVTSTSPDNGRTLMTGGPQAAGITSQGGGADRQWNTFVDATTALIIYNQQAPRNVVVQRSTDGGLTYSPISPIAAPNPRFPGPIKYNEGYTVGGAQGLVYFPWEGNGNSINLSVSKDKGVTWFSCRVGDASANISLFAVADHDTAGNIYVTYIDGGDRHTYLVTVPVNGLVNCDHPAASSQPPFKSTGHSSPLQVDRDAVRSTVFPWVAAGGASGRVAVTFHGTETEGNPDLGTFNASWHVYVNQSLNALDQANRTFSQVKATTHPFHYDSICLGGLSCDLSVPPGDRSLADFYAIGYNRANGKLSVVFNRANKRPDEDAGHVASPMVTTQIAGPSNNGGTIPLDPTRAVVRTLSADPENDALAKYSGLFPAGGTPVNVPAGDFTLASIGPELSFPGGATVPNGGFTVTLKVKDLSTAALTQALVDTGSQSLLWVWRFTNGHQDAAASARWNPAGFTFGYNNFTTGAGPCEPGGNPQSEKCVLYPGGTAIQGAANQTTGTIQISVPRSLLRALSGGQGPGERPVEVPATVGSRFYDGTAFSLGNTLSPVQTLQSWLYPLDNTRSKDFLLPGPTAVRVSSLRAVRTPKTVLLRWRTGSEIGTAGFNVLRAVDGRRVRLNARLISSSASGTSRGHAYAWRDASPARRAAYWLQEVRLDGRRALHGPVAPR